MSEKTQRRGAHDARLVAHEDHRDGAGRHPLPRLSHRRADRQRQPCADDLAHDARRAAEQGAGRAARRGADVGGRSRSAGAEHRDRAHGDDLRRRPQQRDRFRRQRAGRRAWRRGRAGCRALRGDRRAHRSRAKRRPTRCRRGWTISSPPTASSSPASGIASIRSIRARRALLALVDAAAAEGAVSGASRDRPRGRGRDRSRARASASR